MLIIPVNFEPIKKQGTIDENGCNFWTVIQAILELKLHVVVYRGKNSKICVAVQTLKEFTVEAPSLKSPTES